MYPQYNQIQKNNGVESYKLLRNSLLEMNDKIHINKKVYAACYSKKSILIEVINMIKMKNRAI
jgi:hypothetical protein